MSINPYTTIEELCKTRVISVRACNVCQSNSFVTVADLMNYSRKHGRNAFLNLNGCGRRSESELKNILSCVPMAESEMTPFENIDQSVRQTFIDEFEIIAYDPSVEESIRAAFGRLFPNANSFYQVIASPEFSLHHPIFDRIEDGRVKYLLRTLVVKLISEVICQLECRAGAGDLDVDGLLLLSQSLNYSLKTDFLGDYWRYGISDQKREKLYSVFSSFVSQLSGVAQRFQRREFPDVFSVARVIDCDINSFIRRYGRRGFTEEFYHRVLEPFRSKLKVVLSTEDEKLDVVLRFPSLDQDSLEFAINFRKKYGAFPMFFIISQVLGKSEERGDRMFSLLYGLNPDKTIMTRPEIADSYDLSVERVRQIMNGYSVREKLRVSPEDFSHYIDSDVILWSDAEKFSSINEREHIDIQFDAFGKILSELTSFVYCQAGGLEFVVDGRFSCLSDTVDKLYKLSIEKSTEDRYVALNDMLPQDASCKQLSELVLNEVVPRLGITVNEGSLFFPKNCIDVEREAYELLYAKGEPMSGEEIHSELMKKYPRLYSISLSTLKTRLVPSSRVISMGKTSLYKLSHWRAVFGGSIRDLLRKLLSDSDVPLSLEDLTSSVTDVFETNRKNIHSNLSSCDDFVIFKGGFYGMKGKQYPEKYVLSIQSRLTFKERYDEFVDFVSNNRYIPYQCGIAEVDTLARWKANVLSGTLKVSEQEVRQLQVFLDDNSGLPKSNREFEFKQKCSDFMYYVKTKFELPNQVSSPDLYSWYSANFNGYIAYNDNRKLYFEELLSELRSYGFLM